MKSKNLFSISPWGLASVLILLLLGSCTIVRHGEKGAGAPANQPSASAETFDADAYVAGLWAEKIVPTLVDEAVDLKTVIAALRADPEAARAQWGRRKEETAPYAFLVKGRFVVKAANTESSAATLELDTPAPTADGSVQLQIGPVIKTSAVRDSIPFISFGDFTNQVDFANISRALNFKVRDTVASVFPREGAVGQTVAFTGAFLENDSGLVLITPVAAEARK